jgi:hypothetical protein
LYLMTRWSRLESIGFSRRSFPESDSSTFINQPLFDQEEEVEGGLSG